MKRLIYMTIILLLCSCNSEVEYSVVKKVVSDKVIRGNKGQVAFTDYSDIYVSFGVYSAINIGDTLVFKCVHDRTFGNYNCTIDSIIKSEENLR